MGIDSRYVIAPSLEMYFVNKDTGLPLENGQVFFFEDDARTVPKDVFQISGSPPNYSYSVLPNPSLLSAVGTFQDNNGNDIIPYYFPYDAQGNIQLYYIEVYDSMGVLQFTREGWPNTSAQGNITNADVINFVPNGQFLLHDNIPASSSNSYVANQVSQDVTVIAQGGWTFERGPTSTATDFITFPRYSSAVQSPTGNPRYAVQIQTTVAGSDARKDLCLKFPNVNTFASDTQSYNFYFEGQSVTGNDINNVQIIVRKYFGTGGSPSATTETVVTSISLLGSAISKYNIDILFGTNEGKSIGTNNDDYVQIIVRLPPTGIQTALMTDFALVPSDDNLTSFPQQTEAQQIDPSTAGWFPVPNPNGFDLYCPAVLGPSGLLFDHSSIGEIIGLPIPSSNFVGNLLPCDGTTYFTYDYSSLGIPYQRLQQVLFDTSLNGPLFGTGQIFSNTYTSTGLANEFFIITNFAGPQTNPTDGSTATGFTFNGSVNTGSLTTIGFNGYSNSNSVVIAVATSTGAVLNTASAGTSGMTVSDLKDFRLNGYYYAFDVQAVTAAALAAGIGMPGKYFLFSSQAVNYYMWFSVNGEVDPAVGGRTGIQCNLASTMSALDVSTIIAAKISLFQTNTVLVNAVPPAGSFFTFTSNFVTYTVWYKVNGVGTAPNIPRKQLIQVTLTGSETTAQVAFKTQTAMNSQFFLVPNLQGQFLRGTDPTGLVDLNANIRFGLYGRTNVVATFELDQILNHEHGLGNQAQGGGAQAGDGGSGLFTASSGGVESRPINTTVTWYIRY